MSCASRLNGMGRDGAAHRRPSSAYNSSSSSNNNNNNWFHQSLEHLSQGWRKLNQFNGSLSSLFSGGTNNTNRRPKSAAGSTSVFGNKRILDGIVFRKNKRNNKRNRCSSWFVEPYRPVSANASCLIRRPISEESLDFFERFSSLKERAERPRAAARSKQANNRVGVRDLEEAFAVQLTNALHNGKPNNKGESTSPALSESSEEGGVAGFQFASSNGNNGDDVTSPQPAPRAKPRSGRVSAQQVWVWGPELMLGPEAEKVYVEVLYSLVNAISHRRSSSRKVKNGPAVADEGQEEEVFRYLQRAFQFSDEKHAEFLEIVRQKPGPELVLHLGVIQARQLKGKDVNGMSDPYCMACVSSSSQLKQTTSMKPKTLDPIWNETLLFSVKDIGEDVLQLEIWDFDPEETVKEKMSRIGEVKDLRGMGILLKQIASATAKSGGSGESESGKPANHQFLGQLQVPIRTIPLNGLERWYPLEGRDGNSTSSASKSERKSERRGEIRLNMNLSANRPEKPMGLKESFAQYERLMRIIVETEIKADPEWRGKIPEYGEVMLRQLAIHRALRPLVTDVCAWSVYSAALHRRRLDFAGLVLPLLLRLKKSFMNSPENWAKTALPSDVSTAAEDLFNTFWTASEAMITSALSVLRHGMRNHAELAGQPIQLNAILECLKELNTMGSNRPNWKDLNSRISDVVSISAADCWTRVLGGRKKISGPICDDDRLENSIRICQALVADLKLVLTAHQEAFLKWWGMDVFGIVYHYYDGQLAGLVKPIVDSMSRTLKSVHTSEDEIVRLALEASGEVVQAATAEGEEASTAADLNAPRLTMGTALFELYLCLQQFQKLSSSLAASAKEGGNSNDNLKLEHFYSWFGTAMNRWLDMALYKALIIIGKAVNVDNMTTVDSLVKHSSSAVDTVGVFYSIKTFWEQLAWPDTEGSLAYVIKIIDDISRCSLFYAEAIRLKLERLYPQTENESFFISLKICAAINSILYVRSSMKPLAEEMGSSGSTTSQPTSSGQIQAQETRHRLTANALDNLNIKLDEVFYTIARKMECEVAKLINSILESEFNFSTKGKLSAYLFDQLSSLNSSLDDPDLFDHVLHIIHQQILQGFLNVVLLDVDKKKGPECFKNWEQLLNIINESFFGPDHPEWTDETLSKIHSLLNLHSLETAELIHRYRMKKMDDPKDYGLGSLAIKAVFIGDELIVEVLNGRNLKVMDYNGSADPYVKVSVLPPHHFDDVKSQRTKVQKNTLFPLFDETFTFAIPGDMQAKEDCMIMFSVKDKDLITSELIGEAFLSFQRIAKGVSNGDIKDLEQIILPLSVKSNENDVGEYLAILEGRTKDKTAREFANKERKKMME